MATYVTSFVCTESTIPNRWARMQRSQLCDDCHREPAVCLVARPQSASLKPIYQPRCPHSSTFSRITETIPNTQGFFIPQGQSDLRCISEAHGFTPVRRGIRIVSLGESTHGYPHLSSQSAR